MAKPKALQDALPEQEMITVLKIFKDRSQGDNVFAPAFGYEAIEIPASLLDDGKVVDKNIPDLFPIFSSALERWCLKHLGLL